MSSEAARRPTASTEYRDPVAISISLSQNVIVQTSGLSMVSVMGLSIAPWPIVLVWTLVAAVAAGAENHLLRRLARSAGVSPVAAWAPVLRVFTTAVYAVAALALITRGGLGAHLFAFALMSASMIHVLMRYYRSPRILLASLSPYLVVLGLVGFNLTGAALRQGHLIQALAPIFTIAMFVIQSWSARAQLSVAWMELMTAREAAEERERAADAANRAKSQFLANMSHELRTPLNGVLGMAQSLARDQLTRVQQERVRVIRRSSETLLSVLNDLLDLSKIEASAVDIEVVEFDLEHLVRGVGAAYRPLAANKALTFEFEVTQAACGRYLGDSARIRRILYSLSDNAVKFTHAGGVTLRVDRDAGDTVFSITDTGIGIGLDDLAHLFEGFFQVDATLTRRYGGAGIGLAVCKELAAMMGGDIEASSRLGEGSTFILRLPLERVEAQAEPPATERPPLERERPADLRVLAVEDNATNQLVLKTLLAPAGITPTMVDNGREALAAWESQPWDIVLMDIQMPEMNGIDATLAIRQRELQTGRTRTPIVAVTANAMTHQVAQYQAAGMDGVVAKPIDMSNLFQVMELALEQAAGAPAEAGAQRAAT